MMFWPVVLILGVLVQIEGFALPATSQQVIKGEVEILNKLSDIDEINFLNQSQDDGDDERQLVDKVEEFEDTEYDDEVFEGRIVGGEPTSITRFPHQVSLQVNQKHVCGGAIVATNVIITAVHCVVYPTKAKYYTVRVGSNQHERLGQVVQVRRIIKHPQYGPITNDKDVALLVLARHLNYTDEVQAVRLPEAQDQLIDGMELFVSGWGLQGSSQANLPRVLRYVAVNLVNRDVCTRNYQPIQPITGNMICAGAAGKDSCQGDSGGPLVKTEDGVNTLYGIVSFGIGCARPRYPGVYTNVPILMPWIQANLNLINNS